jgi:predicted membrane channel-forming protein YqfA (hemolysin III family)
MDTASPVGLSWGEYYRGLGIAGLFVTVASLAEMPIIDTIEPLVYASGTLTMFALSTVYQLLMAPHRRSLRRTARKR